MAQSSSPGTQNHSSSSSSSHGGAFASLFGGPSFAPSASSGPSSAPGPGAPPTGFQASHHHHQQHHNHHPTGPAAAAATTPATTTTTTTTTATPASAASSSDNTYIMPNSPLKNRGAGAGSGSGSETYRPKITRTLGQRPACLVNASVTYCGNNQIYAFGGFDQYTDEVYNHVLRLDLVSQQWNLVDNYGDIPGVRMGHTATLYQGDKLLVFGGENEHRTYLSDLIIFDLKTAHWTQPPVSGPVPKGRARHAAVLHEDRLFIIGGITGHDNYVLDDICYLDLKTFTWSRAWRFVGRFDHSAHVWNDRVWVFGGLGEDMDKGSDLWWLDLKGSPAFQSSPQIGSVYDRSGMGLGGMGGMGGMGMGLGMGLGMEMGGGVGLGGGSSAMGMGRGSPRPGYAMAAGAGGAASSAVGASGYAANSRTAQVNTPSFQLKAFAPVAPGAISSLKFASGPSVPNQSSGIHFHVYTSGMLLDFVTPAPTITSRECSLSTLDLSTLRWQKLADGRELFRPGYRWHYCTMNEDGTKAWLLGCPTDLGSIDLGANGGLEEYLSDIMEIDLRRYGFLGNTLAGPDDGSYAVYGGYGGHLLPPPAGTLMAPSRLRHVDPPSKGLGADLARLFDQPPETGSGTDFIVTAHSGNWDEDDEDDEDDDDTDMVGPSGSVSGSSMNNNNNNNNNINTTTTTTTTTTASRRGTSWLAPDTPTSPPIHVHRLILQARWPHFARLWASQMAEFHTKKMHIPEPYSVVRAFLFYLYTDRIDASPEELVRSASGGVGDGNSAPMTTALVSTAAGRDRRGRKGGRKDGKHGKGSGKNSAKDGKSSASSAGAGASTSAQHTRATAAAAAAAAATTTDGDGTRAGGVALSDVAGLLVMSNIYNMPHLRLLCVNRLAKELDVAHACIIWHCASLANEAWLRRRAAVFCLTHWGRIVRSAGFLRLPRAALVELSQEIDTEGRVIGGDEADLFGSALLDGSMVGGGVGGVGGVGGGVGGVGSSGGLGGSGGGGGGLGGSRGSGGSARFSDGGSALSPRKESMSSGQGSQMAESDAEEEMEEEEEEEEEDEDEDEMEME